jgi:hypothetical protein
LREERKNIFILGGPNGSGRFFTDEELAAGGATGELNKKEKSESEPAA